MYCILTQVLLALCVSSNLPLSSTLLQQCMSSLGKVSENASASITSDTPGQSRPHNI